jgi:hypothetical protein
VALKGLSVFDVSSAEGALSNAMARARASGSNLTSMRGWGVHPAGVGALHQFGILPGVSTNLSFFLLANCSGGEGCFVKGQGSAIFRQCLFVDNPAGAVAHVSGATMQTRLESCHFVNTRLRGGRLLDGSVLVDSCLFAGEVQSLASFILTGVQISFTSTEIEFDTASQLPTCGGVAGLPAQTPEETPRGTSNETPRDAGTPSGNGFRTPGGSIPAGTPAASRSAEGKRGLTRGGIAGVVIGGLVFVAAAVVVGCCWRQLTALLCREGVDKEDAPVGDTEVTGPKPAPDAAPEDGHWFRTSLQWDASMDSRGSVRRFPLEKDAFGKCLPLLLAAFDKDWLMNVLVPQAVTSLEPEAGALLMLGVDTSEAGEERLRDNAIQIYTRPEICRETNRLLRLESDHNEPDAPLWPFVAILQMAFVKAIKDLTGAPLYRGGLISRVELDDVRESLAAGHDGELVLRGVTPCSRLENVAVQFARKTLPTATMVRVLFSVSMEQVEDTVAKARQPGLAYGPAVPIEHTSKTHREEDVVLLDGTVLKVSPGDLKEGRTLGFQCVQIKARVDWDALGAYFALCDAAGQSPG